MIEIEAKPSTLKVVKISTDSTVLKIEIEAGTAALATLASPCAFAAATSPAV